MYTKFNHRPEQKFAYERKPKIRVIGKHEFGEFLKHSTNPVQFEKKEEIILSIDCIQKIHLLKNLDHKLHLKKNQHKLIMNLQIHQMKVTKIFKKNLNILTKNILTFQKIMLIHFKHKFNNHNLQFNYKVQEMVQSINQINGNLDYLQVQEWLCKLEKRKDQSHLNQLDLCH